MSNEQVLPVEDNLDPAGGEDKKPKDSVSYDSHRKLLTEKKKADAERVELARKLKEYEEKEMTAQGKTNELNESLRTQLKEKEEKLNKVVGNFAHRTVASVISAEATKQGCIDVELLMKAGDFSAIEVNPEDFSVNEDDMKRFFETTRAKHPKLFSAGGPRINDGLPGKQPPATPKTFEQKTSAELIKEWENLKQ
jgi:hypothetical protein